MSTAALRWNDTFDDGEMIGDAPPDQYDETPEPADRTADLDDIKTRHWTVEEMLAECVMLQDGAQVTLLNQPHIAVPFGTWKILTAGSYDMVPTKKGERHVLRANVWNESDRQEVWGRTHAPGRGQICEDPKGDKCVNLWRERPHSAPVDWQDHVRPFLYHLEYLLPIAEERERFLDWLGHAEQIPGTRPHTHYLWRTRGTQGVGRNWVAEVLARMWKGNVSLSVDLMGMLAGNFNGLIAGSLLGVVDELHVEQAGTSLRKLSQALKTEMTQSIRNVRPKYGREYVEWCCTRWLMFSNHVAALPIAEEDRRIVVIENPDKARSADYYSHLYGLLDDAGFIASVREFLIRRDISRFNPGEHAPMSAAKQETIDATTSEWDMEAKGLVETWGSDVILTQDLTFMLKDSAGMSPASHLVGKIANDALMTSSGKKQIKFGGPNPKRYWFLRNAERWKTAKSFDIAEEIRKGRQAHTPGLADGTKIGGDSEYRSGAWREYGDHRG